MAMGQNYSGRRRDLDTIPPRREVRQQLARLKYLCHEAIGMCWVMDERKRDSFSEMLSTHLYASGCSIDSPFMAVEPVAP